MVKPKVVKRENRNSTHRPNVNNDASMHSPPPDRLLTSPSSFSLFLLPIITIELDGRSEKAHHRPDDEEVELLKREVHLLAESNTDLQQKAINNNQ